MLVSGKPFRTIWSVEDGGGVYVIDQTRLPHEFVVEKLVTLEDVARAITTMVVRGAPLIGAAAGYGMALAARQDASNAGLERAAATLVATRPTAVNLRWAVQRQLDGLRMLKSSARAEAASLLAERICEEDVASCSSIGDHGARIIAAIAAKKKDRVNLLTHCNAGWLCAVDWGTALAPIFKAHEQGVDLHVWVDETRPRNQGAALTAWELKSHGVPHTLVVDNAGGHLMQRGKVDMVIVGSDRTAANGDVGNKIGTYLKALAAADNGVPFFAALPVSTIDWTLKDGRDCPIEERDSDEVLWVRGRTRSGAIDSVLIAPEGVVAANPAFDVTPARFVEGIITERGVAKASAEGLRALYPEMARK